MTTSAQAFQEWEAKQAESGIPPREQALLRAIGKAVREVIREERTARVAETTELRGQVRKLQLEVARLKTKP